MTSNDETISRSGRRRWLLGGQMGSPSAAEREELLDENFRSVPFWWDDLGQVAPAEGELPDNVDFLVAGAGYSGLSAGRTLAAHGARVLIADAEHPFFGASSRNTGCWVQAYETGADLSTPQARAFFDEFLVSNEFLRNLLEEDGIDAIIGYGRYAAASHRSHFNVLKKSAKSLFEAHKFNYDVVEPGDSTLFRSTVTPHGGIFAPGAPYLQPAKLAYGHYQGALRKGAQVLGKTRVTAVRRDTNGSYLVATSRGVVRARGVLLAVGGYGARDFSAHRNVLPVRASQIATTPLSKEQLASIWQRPISMKNSKHRFEVVLPSPDSQRLIISGRIGRNYASPEARAVHLVRLAREMFPQLGEIRASHAWEGVFGMSTDRRKHLFKDGDGVYSLTADNGGGVGMMQWLGHKAALQMMGMQEGKTVVASDAPPPSFPLYINGSDWFMPGAIAFYDLRDKFNF